MVEAVLLVNLHAAAMAVKIAVGANVHQNVEAELLPRAVGAQQLVMAPAMAHAEIDDLLAPRLVQAEHRLAQLPVGMARVFVQQRRRQLDLQRLLIEQIDRRSRSNALSAHQLGFRLRQLLLRGKLVGAGLGVLHQRGRSPGLAQ